MQPGEGQRLPFGAPGGRVEGVSEGQSRVGLGFLAAVFSLMSVLVTLSVEEKVF